MVRNPSFPQPNLVTADELFVDGVILPLHLLPNPNSDDPPDPVREAPNSEPPPIPNPGSEPANITDPKTESRPGPEIAAGSSAVLTASKRWKDIFKKSDKKIQEDKEKDKEKKKERKNQSGASSAELNINLWPFSRSRSAGNGGNRPRMVAGAQATRKVSSAPCSRSNSAGESKSRKWPSSPGRAGVHLGRTSPVWQVRRGGSGLKVSEPVVRNPEKGVNKKGNTSETRRSKVGGGVPGGNGKGKVLNLNVPTCIGYRSPLSCRSDENSAIEAGGGAPQSGGAASESNVGGGGSNLFNLRSLFTKKVY